MSRRLSSNPFRTFCFFFFLPRVRVCLLMGLNYDVAILNPKSSLTRMILAVCVCVCVYIYIYMYICFLLKKAKYNVFLFEWSGEVNWVLKTGFIILGFPFKYIQLFWISWIDVFSLDFGPLVYILTIRISSELTIEQFENCTIMNVRWWSILNF